MRLFALCVFCMFVSMSNAYITAERFGSTNLGCISGDLIQPVNGISRADPLISSADWETSSREALALNPPISQRVSWCDSLSFFMPLFNRSLWIDSFSSTIGCSFSSFNLLFIHWVLNHLSGYLIIHAQLLNVYSSFRGHYLYMPPLRIDTFDDWGGGGGRCRRGGLLVTFASLILQSSIPASVGPNQHTV